MYALEHRSGCLCLFPTKEKAMKFLGVSSIQWGMLKKQKDYTKSGVAKDWRILREGNVKHD